MLSDTCSPPPVQTRPRRITNFPCPTIHSDPSLMVPSACSQNSLSRSFLIASKVGEGRKRLGESLYLSTVYILHQLSIPSLTRPSPSRLLLYHVGITRIVGICIMDAGITGSRDISLVIVGWSQTLDDGNSGAKNGNLVLSGSQIKERYNEIIRIRELW